MKKLLMIIALGLLALFFVVLAGLSDRPIEGVIYTVLACMVAFCAVVLVCDNITLK